LNTPWDNIRVVGIKETGVKHRVDLHASGKVEFERHLAFANDIEDLVWTEAFVIELSRGTSCRNISPR
jgi:hypothetical protein